MFFCGFRVIPFKYLVGQNFKLPRAEQYLRQIEDILTMDGLGV